MKPGMSSCIYLTVTIVMDSGEKQCFLLHRLVAIHFVEGYSEGLEAHHISHNKLDCSASNLQWVTGSVNSKESFKHLINRE